MLLFPFHALGGYKVHFRFAVVAVEQSRKKACPAGFRRSALVFAKFLHPQPLLLGDDGFLHVGDDLVILLAVLDSFMDFVTDGSAFKLTAQPVYCLFSRIYPTVACSHPQGFLGTFCACFLPMDSK